MPAPSPLAIATSAVQRLVKEEASYHKELSQQEERVAKLQANEAGEENAEFQLTQEQAAVEETKAVIPVIRKRIADAIEKLGEQLEAGEEKGASEEEISKAKEVIAGAKAVIN